MAILHLHGSLTGSSDHQYSATVRSSRENPGISFLKRGRNPTRLIYSTASSTSWMHFGSFHFTPCMIHSPASFPMTLSFLCFAVLSIPHIDRVRQRYVYFCKKNDDISNLNLFVYPRPHPSDNISCSLRYLYASSVQRLLLFL